MEIRMLCYQWDLRGMDVAQRDWRRNAESQLIFVATNPEKTVRGGDPPRL